MTNEPISQEEIDALLRGAAQAEEESSSQGRWEPLRRAVKTGLAAAWSVAPALVGGQAEAGPVEVQEATAAAVAESMGGEVVWSALPVGQAKAYVLLDAPFAQGVVQLVLGGEVPGEGLADAGAEALSEILSQLMGKGIQTVLEQAKLSDALGGVTLTDLDSVGTETRLVAFSQPVQVEGGVNGTLTLALPGDLAERLLDAISPEPTAGTQQGSQPPIGSTAALTPERTAAPSVPPAAAAAPPPTVHPTPPAATGAQPAPQPFPAQPAAPQQSAPAPQQPESVVSYQPVQFQDFGQPGQKAPAAAESQGDSRNLDLLLDVSLQVTVELGRTHRQIRDVLSLTPGSVLELEKLAGEPVEVLVNGKLIARGEVVVIDEHFGVRITDIISPAERAASLGR